MRVRTTTSKRRTYRKRAYHVVRYEWGGEPYGWWNTHNWRGSETYTCRPGKARFICAICGSAADEVFKGRPGWVGMHCHTPPVTSGWGEA